MPPADSELWTDVDELNSAVYAGDVARVALLLRDQSASGAELLVCTPLQGCAPPLCVAAQAGAYDISELLLQAGADPDARNEKAGCLARSGCSRAWLTPGTFC